MRRIVKIDDNMTWANFKKKFAGFFPVSNKEKEVELLKAEYFRLTGRKVK